MLTTQHLAVIAAIAAVVGPVAVFLSLFLFGIRRWKESGSKFTAIVAGVLLLFVIACVGVLLLTPDIYVHDTYFRNPVR